MIIELLDEAMDVPFEILKGPSLNPNIALWATVRVNENQRKN
jgi:hypothetical protein